MFPIHGSSLFARLLLIPSMQPAAYTLSLTGLPQDASICRSGPREREHEPAAMRATPALQCRRRARSGGLRPKAAADAAADAAAASGTVKKGGEGLDAASAAIEAVETERARQARRAAALNSWRGPEVTGPKVGYLRPEKFRRLSRGARDCVRAKQLSGRSLAVLRRPRVVSDDLGRGDGMDGDSDLEEGGQEDRWTWATRYVPCPEVALQLDDKGRGEYVPAAGDAPAEFTWAASYDMAYDYDEEEMAWLPDHEAYRRPPGPRTPRARAAPRGSE